MKLLLGLFFAFILTISVSAQESQWELYSTVDGVEIYTMESDCHASNIPEQKAILIKVVNKTSSRLKMEFDQAIWYNDKLVTGTSDGENHFTLELNPNSSQEGTCEVPMGALYIYKDFITYKTDTKLTKFELQNLTIIRL